MMFRNQSSFGGAADFFPQHKEYLQARAVSLDLARACGLCSVSKHEGAPLVGWQSLPSDALAIPYSHRTGEKNDHWRLRLDQPTFRPDKDPIRFAVAKDEGVRPYLPPSIPESVWRDPKIIIWIVESPIKALALLSVGIFAIGLAGCSAGGHDKEAKEKGEFKLHPELRDRLTCEGRTFGILMDSNRRRKRGVYEGEKLLAKCLEEEGAQVLVAEMPPQLPKKGEKEVEDWGPDDFLAARGVEELRKVLDAARPAREVHHPFEEIKARLLHTEKGKVLSSAWNATLILALDPRWEGVLAWDDLNLSVTTRKPPPWDEEYTPNTTLPGWRDEDDTRLAVWLERHWGLKLSSAQAGSVARMVAQKSSFHPVRAYLQNLQWDGVNRLDTWLSTYFGVADTPYSRAVGAKWMISAVARAFQPGCEVKYMLILEGPQDLGKSAALRGLFGEEWFTDQISDFSKKDASQDLWGKWVVELAELDALLRAEPASTKAFLSRTKDHFAPRYGRRALDFPRQAVFVGTVNENAYLKDATGNVRFWPVRCTRADREGTKRDREQLLAEAVLRYQRGESWWLEDGEVIAQAREEQEARYVGDAWEEQIAAWIESRESVSVSEVLAGVFGVRPEDMGQREQNRVAKALGRLSWERFRKRLGKNRYDWRYRPGNVPSVPTLGETGNTSGNTNFPSNIKAVPSVPSVPTLKNGVKLERGENPVEL
jgi:predicted P-loop ATPase